MTFAYKRVPSPQYSPVGKSACDAEEQRWGAKQSDQRENPLAESLE
jgi:hypothetical protein